MISFVVAMANNNVIGKNNSLAWSLPVDLKRFKDITLTKTKTMIMGRKTFEALPKVLPGRKHVVLTRNKHFAVNYKDVKILHNIEDLKFYIESGEEYFVIGGGELFNSLMPYVQKIYLTIIHHDFEGDTFFPSYNEKDWEIIENFEGVVDDRNKYEHTFLTMVRKNMIFPHSYQGN
ncbi:dihydrofolate reductase [Clostridium bovifaecis]|uniref:Dihydrofolate reductase n=1 Tax=Clostridium bovifaecis TaxID=2184719 RepID=A0A6I6ERR0_9CLOT|nr:dihydrofolate reductase [Clostridium bovifaecis]